MHFLGLACQCWLQHNYIVNLRQTSHIGDMLKREKQCVWGLSCYKLQVTYHVKHFPTLWIRYDRCSEHPAPALPDSLLASIRSNWYCCNSNFSFSKDCLRSSFFIPNLSISICNSNSSFCCLKVKATVVEPTNSPALPLGLCNVASKTPFSFKAVLSDPLFLPLRVQEFSFKSCSFVQLFKSSSDGHWKKQQQ